MICIKSAVRRRVHPRSVSWLHYLPTMWMFYEPTAIRVLVALSLALLSLPVAVFRRV